MKAWHTLKISGNTRCHCILLKVFHLETEKACRRGHQRDPLLWRTSQILTLSGTWSMWPLSSLPRPAFICTLNPPPPPTSPHSRDPALLCGLGKEKKCMSFKRICLSVGSEASEWVLASVDSTADWKFCLVHNVAERSLSGGLKWTGCEADGVLTEQGMSDWDPQRNHTGLMWEMNYLGDAVGRRVS